MTMATRRVDPATAQDHLERILGGALLTTVVYHTHFVLAFEHGDAYPYPHPLVATGLEVQAAARFGDRATWTQHVSRARGGLPRDAGAQEPVLAAWLVAARRDRARVQSIRVSAPELLVELESGLRLCVENADEDGLVPWSVKTMAPGTCALLAPLVTCDCDGTLYSRFQP